MLRLWLFLPLLKYLSGMKRISTVSVLLFALGLFCNRILKLSDRSAPLRMGITPGQGVTFAFSNYETSIEETLRRLDQNGNIPNPQPNSPLAPRIFGMIKIIAC